MTKSITLIIVLQLLFFSLDLRKGAGEASTKVRTDCLDRQIVCSLVKVKLPN